MNEIPEHWPKTYDEALEAFCDAIAEHETVVEYNSNFFYDEDRDVFRDKIKGVFSFNEEDFSISYDGNLKLSNMCLVNGMMPFNLGEVQGVFEFHDFLKSFDCNTSLKSQIGFPYFAHTFTLDCYFNFDVFVLPSVGANGGYKLKIEGPKRIDPSQVLLNRKINALFLSSSTIEDFSFLKYFSSEKGCLQSLGLDELDHFSNDDLRYLSSFPSISFRTLKNLTSFKGLSKFVKSCNSIQIVDMNNEVDGLLEFCMIENLELIILVSAFAVKIITINGEEREEENEQSLAIRIINEHLPNPDIFEVQTLLIESGYGHLT